MLMKFEGAHAPVFAAPRVQRFHMDIHIYRCQLFPFIAVTLCHKDHSSFLYKRSQQYNVVKASVANAWLTTGTEVKYKIRHLFKNLLQI